MDYSTEEFQQMLENVQDFRDLFFAINDRRARLGLLQKHIQSNNKVFLVLSRL
jgi:hypothetical protein